VLDVASVVAFALLWVALAARLVGSADALVLLACFTFALPIGYLVADFVSGLVHWFADSFFEENAALIGPLFIEPFREHHRDPAGITRHGFFEITGNNCLVTIPVLAAFWLWGERTGPFAVALVLSTALAVFATNPIHRWAHSRKQDLPRSVVWLQQRGLILSAHHHAKHHAGANERAYCVTCGWLNPVLDRFDLFGRLRNWVRRRGRRPGAHA
jgi:ubiquitin-conjugating enzyme E2 variant